MLLKSPTAKMLTTLCKHRSPECWRWDRNLWLTRRGNRVWPRLGFSNHPVICINPHHTINLRSMKYQTRKPRSNRQKLSQGTKYSLKALKTQSTRRFSPNSHSFKNLKGWLCKSHFCHRWGSLQRIVCGNMDHFKRVGTRRSRSRRH